MCRFMLNLTQAGDPDSETGLDSLSIILGPMSRIHFTQNHAQSQSVASGDSEAGCISQFGHADTHILAIKGRSDIEFANIVWTVTYAQQHRSHIVSTMLRRQLWCIRHWITTSYILVSTYKQNTHSPERTGCFRCLSLLECVMYWVRRNLIYSLRF